MIIHQIVRVRPQPNDWFVLLLGILAFSAIFWFFVLKIPPSPKTGPKMIEADGATYVACGGALWLANEGPSKDPGEMSYRVLFKDADGQSHELKLVRMLKVSDLPPGSSYCRSPQ
jgi:hypothetical protein